MNTSCHTVADIFQQAKPHLMGIAYRMLGTCRDSEDIVQEVYLKLAQADVSTLDSPNAWMTTVCTRLCLDRIKSAQNTRLDYVGAWLPEPVSEDYGSEHFMELSATLSTAFLLVLERLSPKERAVFLLREVFDHDYSVIASATDISESACRKLLSRAKENIQKSEQRFTIDTNHQKKLLACFETAVRDGDTHYLQTLLARDVVLNVDGGGKVPAISKDLFGERHVSQFISRALHRYWQDMKWTTTSINGQLGAVICDESTVHSILSFGYDKDSKVSQVMIIRNPDKMNSFLS